MAWLEQDTSGHFKICFRWGKRKLKKTLKTSDSKDAHFALARFSENLRLLKRGRLELPAGADVACFLLSDGKLSGNADAVLPAAVPKLSKLIEDYVAIYSNGSVEANTLRTIRVHLRHLARTLGATFRIASLSLLDLQRHIDRRSRQLHRGKAISAVTIRKELATFRGCWNWACQAYGVEKAFPSKGLKYPKTNERPHFQTRADIQRQIQRGGLLPTEEKELWECLFLTRPETEEVLETIRTRTRSLFLYPMACTAAYTGARRSELMRAKIDDVDFATGTILFQEKKRVPGRRTFRRVPMTAKLQTILQDWIAKHPGGQRLFATVYRTMLKGIRLKSAQGSLRRTLKRTPWAVIRGWHVLRHSFASNCAAAGVDQRLINEWMGHQTDEMVRRYRHLFPEQQRKAIASVFG